VIKAIIIILIPKYTLAWGSDPGLCTTFGLAKECSCGVPIEQSVCRKICRKSALRSGIYFASPRVLRRSK